MKKINLFTFLILAVVLINFSSCQREHVDESNAVWEEIPPAEASLLTNYIEFSSELGSDLYQTLQGEGRISDFMGEVYYEVIVPANLSGTSPFLIGWTHPTLETHSGTDNGLTFTIYFLDENNQIDQGIDSGLGIDDFSVNLIELGEVGDVMRGEFSGMGKTTFGAQTVAFQGKFSVMRKQ